MPFIEIEIRLQRVLRLITWMKRTRNNKEKYRTFQAGTEENNTIKDIETGKRKHTFTHSDHR